MIDLATSLTSAIAEIVERVQRSLVVLHNGQNGVGAGIIWSRDGLIVTNHHVIVHGHSRASLPDGRDYPARVIAQDPEIDLAMMQIEAQDLPVALVADSRNLQVGQLVLAVGHPWGQRGVVTAGLISGLSKAHTRGKRGSVEIIRSDVRLAPGNSGGPLVNAIGAVVGINTMIIGGDLGLAIPSHVVSAFADQIMGKAEQPKERRRSHSWTSAERIA